MDFFDSESLTPPGSPVLGYSGLRDSQQNDPSFSSGPLPVYCFNCKGPIRPHDKSFSSDGFFLRSAVISVIKKFTAQNNAPPDRGKMSHVSFFGHKFDPTDNDQLAILVRMCLKGIYTLENVVLPSTCMGSNGTRNLNADQTSAELLKIRWNICSFLNFMTARGVPLTPSETENLFDGLRKNIERSESWSTSLQLHCGSKFGNECTSPEYHLFHLQFEIRWFLLVIFKFNTMVLNWVIEDLLYLAYAKFKSNDINLLEKNPFNCYCVNELWAMIRSAVDQLKPNGKGFWEIVATPLASLDTESNFIFPLWLFANLVTLNNYGTNGVYTPISNNNHNEKLEDSVSSYALINGALKYWVLRGGRTFEVNELLFKLLPYWGFDLDVTLTLWNTWLPKVDNGFEVMNLEPYASSGKWLQLISDIVNSDNETSASDKTGGSIFSKDHFVAFLRLFCAHIKLCSQKDWRKLKSNICNKLPQKTVSGFTENGLTRISTMFLALALVTGDSESMCERLNETLSYGKDSLAIMKLRARCVMILIFLRKGFRVSQISAHVMRTVNEIMGMSVSGRTSTHKDLVMTYLDFLENIPKFNGDLNLGQSGLISLNLTMWLSNCGPNYVNRTLRVLHNILEAWILGPNCVPTSEKEIFARIIQDKTEQFLKQTVISNQNRNPEFDVQPLADLAVDLTILQSCKKNSIAVASLYETFALNPNTSPQISEIFVEQVVNSSLPHNVFALVNENQLRQSWIRLITLGCAVPQKLTEKVLGSSDVSSYRTPSDNEIILRRFCASASEPGNYWTRSLLQNTVTPAVDALKAAKNNSFGKNGSVVDAIVNSVLILFRNLPFCNIYLRNSQSSFVHQVLETCCPNFVGKPPWEKLPDTFLAALNKYLPNIFLAVYSHNSWLDDPYLKRKMCDLVRFAILGFVKGEELEDINPGVRIMQHCEAELLAGRSSDATIQEISSIINSLNKDDVVAKRFLLVFVGFLNRRMMVTAVYLLGSVIELLVEKVELSHRCRSIVSLTWGSILARDSYCYLKPTLLAGLEDTMKKHFAFRSDRFFELLFALAANGHQRIPIRKLIKDSVIPILSNQVMLSEMKQASGTNYKLRGLLKKLQKEVEL